VINFGLYFQGFVGLLQATKLNLSIFRGRKSTMKRIDIDDDLYTYIASHTRQIGESASDILRRLLDVNSSEPEADSKSEPPESVLTV
jgi:negative regulator of replication initiation SeqA